jgi:metal-dependent amidase/aminoacylase/carboxypeptidase family protein
MGRGLMIADGLFERFPADAVFGMHNMPCLPRGKQTAKSRGDCSRPLRDEKCGISRANNLGGEDFTFMLQKKQVSCCPGTETRGLTILNMYSMTQFFSREPYRIACAEHYLR